MTWAVGKARRAKARAERAGQADRIDLDEQTARLRGLAIRAAAFGMIWLACIAAGVFLLIAADDAAQRLLDTGTRVPGHVVSAQRGKNSAIQVRYRPAGGEDVRVVWIAWESSRDYAPGYEVTVVYDPADQARVRTTGERNLDERSSWAPATVFFVAAIIGLPLAVMAVSGWRRRYRAVRATGWRAATATRVVYEQKRSRKSIVMIEVECPDGSTAEVEPVASTHGARHPAGKAWQVWVGGRGDDMVVLYPRSRWRDKPFAVPVKGKIARRGRSKRRS